MWKLWINLLKNCNVNSQPKNWLIHLGLSTPNIGCNQNLKWDFLLIWQFQKLPFDSLQRWGLMKYGLQHFFSYCFEPTKIFIYLYHEEWCQNNNAEPLDLNTFTKLWRTLSSSHIFEHPILEYIKLIELHVVQFIGSIMDEWCFFTLTFMRTKLKNWLTLHLELVIWTVNQKFFTMESFPYGTTIQSWKYNKIGYGGMMEELLNFTIALCFHGPCLFGYDDSLNIHPTPFWAF